MDLLLKVGILILALVVIASAVFLIFVHTTQAGPLTKQQAESLVLNDIISQNPNAAVTVVSASPSILANNSWSIVLSIVYNGTKPCPTLFIQEYDYPALTFVNGTNNQYSKEYNNTPKGCIIYGLSTAPTYVISSPQIAIARSYGSNSSIINNYVGDFGYNNVNVYATFYPTISASMTPLNQTYSNVWIVNYTTPIAHYNQYVILGQSGQIVANYTKATT